ncbi:thiamine phosphate synthase [Hymenobacter cheonanensis]|uniref:thiamine phosphate synthase n=1 Tax=Hymenobacter sp. CA2-7 TaxID=3063993 RepID=UPI0027143981|nr:thiamine phosphate synthase [Hymenobacter sp. CA2-7]MDO7884944.1 thiamine phosphate synthase [Hymenobacter sp. CA2-7]
MFRLVVITAPTALSEEPRLLAALLAAGLQRLHLRKPGWPAEELAQLVEALPTHFHSRLVLHGHPALVRRYGLGGLHLTASQRAAAARRPALLPGQTLSTSFHSLAEVAHARRRYDYVFLSPIFDSLSKAGYASNFDLATVRTFLQKRAASPTRQPQVVALGGIDSQTSKLARTAGFAGAAVLGAIWQSPDPVAAFRELRVGLG